MRGSRMSAVKTVANTLTWTALAPPSIARTVRLPDVAHMIAATPIIP